MTPHRLLPLLPEEAEGAMRMKELTAAAVGVTRLGLPADVTGPLVEAFESRVRAAGLCAAVVVVW